MMVMRKPRILLSVALTLACLAGATNAIADTLVDRGLPTANLNNAAGADRSNVAWAYAAYTSPDYWIVGDTFTNTSAQTWLINSIRLWTVGQTDTTILRGGIDGSTIGVISGATYADPSASLYQGSSGNMIAMHQIDFSVNITLAAGQTYDFFLDGSGSAAAGQDTSVPFVHASNAARSGSPQDGADNMMLYANVLGGTVDPLSVGSWDSNAPGVWDKSSDVNVQVFGVAAIPEPETYAMMLAGLGLLSFMARRRKQKEAAA
jgi:hypothetical protein